MSLNLTRAAAAVAAYVLVNALWFTTLASQVA